MESTINAAPQIFIDREKMLRSHRHYWVLRRAQDIVFSLLALILLAPLALLISLAIVLDSPGDGAIFRQRRVGRDGKLFWLYKFRTMCPDAEEQLNELLNQNQMCSRSRATPALPGWDVFCARPVWTSYPSCSTCCGAI